MANPTTLAYDIEVDAFNGPLDLLLHLIDRSELDITEISLAEVTDQYLQQVERLKEGRITHLIDFIVIGARLVLIKSRAILPTPPVVLEGEEEEEDPAEALIRQLKQYKRFKEAGKWLADRDRIGMRTYLRTAPPPKVKGKLDLSNVTTDRMRDSMLDVLLRLSLREDSVKVARPRTITIADQIGLLRRTVTRYNSFHFRDLLSGKANRTEVGVTLLAVLEMIKRREVAAEQEEMFGPIVVEKFVPPEIPPEGTFDAEA